MSPGTHLYYQIEVHDTKTGKLVRRGRKRVARSFCVAYTQFIRGLMNFVNEAGVKDTGGTDRTLAITSQVHMLRSVGAATITTHGTRVGTGTTAVAMTDFEIETPIAEGTGSGQLEHGTTVIGTVAEGASESSFTVVRTFANSSGATITVTETGIYSEGELVGGGTDIFFLIVRDVLSSSQAVADGQTLTVTYTIKVTT